MPHIDSNKTLWREVDGKVVVLLISSGNFIELNKTGSTVWKFLAEGKTVDGIVSAMLETYNVAREELVSDVNAYIGQMVSRGLLQD